MTDPNYARVPDTIHCPLCRKDHAIDITYAEHDTITFYCRPCNLEFTVIARADRRVHPRTIGDAWSDAMRDQYRNHHKCTLADAMYGPYGKER
jgi:hypothetical protein